MVGVSGNREACHSFFGFVQGNSIDHLMGNDGSSRNKSTSLSEERKLELRLGPPGGEEEFWSVNKELEEKASDQHRNETLISSSYFSHMASAQNTINDTNNLNSRHKFTTGPALKTSTSSGSQKRSAAPVVGWPPIRSSRRNLSSSNSLKQPPTSQDAVPNKFSMEKPAEVNGKGLFVKINMDGVPIGRKVDLKACDSYEKLASSVDQLFRSLLAAQQDTPSIGIKIKREDEKPISGLLDGKGEYTLVYEDNEGDTVLVGDVPWDIFVSTVKRLRVLKSTELPAINSGGNELEKTSLGSGPSSRLSTQAAVSLEGFQSRA